MSIDTYLQFLLLGIGAGAIYAAIALGLLLAYRSSGVINFAHGAAAMYAAYVFVGLRVDGDLLLPLPGAPGRIHVHVLPTAAAAAVAVVATSMLELGVYYVVFRPLRRAPALSRLLASVGVMVALQAIVTLQYGADAVSVPRVLPATPLHLGNVVLPSDRLWLAAIIVAATAASWAAYRFTRFGLASRAAAEDELALALTGWNPDRVAAVNWGIAGALAGGAGVLAGPIVTADPVTFTLLVVPALAAALLGGFSSFVITTAAALGLGMVQSELVEVQAHASWLPATGVGKALPLLLIAIAAITRGALMEPRGRIVARALPSVGAPLGSRWPIAVGAAGGVLATFALHGDYRLALINSLIGAVVCLSVVVITGYLGLLSLAQLAFAGVAGFALTRMQHPLGLPFPLDALVAALLAAAAGVVVALPALRVRGPSLAVVTLAAALATEALLFQSPTLTGGFTGTPVRPPKVAGHAIGPGRGGAGYPHIGFTLLVLGVTALAALGVVQLRRSALGRRMLAVRADERATAALGASVNATKVAGFAISAFLAGLAGVMVGWEQGQLSFGSFDVVASLALVALAYVGGVGRVSGALLAGCLVSGGLLFVALDNAFGLGRYQLLASAVAVVLAIVVAPDGITGTAAKLAHRQAGRHR